MRIKIDKGWKRERESWGLSERQTKNQSNKEVKSQKSEEARIGECLCYHEGKQEMMEKAAGE